MAYPTGQVQYEPIPNTRRTHVVLTTAEGVPVMCGSASDWPFGPHTGNAQMVVILSRVNDCDHGGTHREPVSVWTGEPR